MNFIFKVMMFSIFLNLAIGITITFIPAFADDISTHGGVEYSNTFQDTFNTLQTNLTPAGVLEDQGNSIYRVLDTLNLGFIQKFVDVVLKYAYGIVLLFDNVFGGYLSPEMYSLLFGKATNANIPVGIFYHIITVGYIIGGYFLWTGKDLSD